MWSYRPGVPADQQLQELEKTFGYQNIKDNPVLDAFPGSESIEFSRYIVLDGATLYEVIVYNGKRYRKEYTVF